MEDLENRVNSLLNEMTEKAMIVYYFIGQIPYKNEISLFTFGNWRCIELIEQSERICKQILNDLPQIKEVGKAAYIKENDKLKQLPANIIPYSQIIKAAEKSKYNSLIKEKYGYENVNHLWPTLKEFAEDTANEFENKYRDYFSWHPILQRWVNYLREGEFNSEDSQLSAKDKELDVDKQQENASIGQPIPDQHQFIKDTLKCLSGNWLGKNKIMSEKDFDRLVKYCITIVEKGKVPNKIVAIEQTPATIEFIRYTFYLLYKEYKPKIQKSRSVWIDFVHATFSQFKTQSKDTTDKNFKTVNNYLDMVKMCSQEK